MTAASAPPRRAFAVWWKDLENWNVLSTLIRRQFRSSHPLRALKELVTVRWQTATAEQFASGAVSMVDRVSFGGEIFAGGRCETKMQQFVAMPGDLVVSKIRARQGSIGLVDSTHGMVSVTIHYRALTPRGELLNPSYAWLALRSSFCRAQFLAATGGAMKGEVSEEGLLQIEIPLPPLAEQAAIVGRWRDAQTQIAAARARVEGKKADIDARFFADLGLNADARAALPKCFAVLWKDFLRWGVNYNQQRQTGLDITQGKFQVVELGSILDLVQYGTSEKANSAARGTAVLRIGNIKEGSLDLSDLKHVELPQTTLDSLQLREGDIVIIRTSGSRDLVGTCAVFHGTEDFVFASYLIRLRVTAEKAEPEFVSWFINSPLGRLQVDSVSRQIMQNNINSEELRGLQIPLPPVPVQQEIMARVQTGRAEIGREHEAAARRTREITAEIEARILGTGASE